MGVYCNIGTFCCRRKNFPGKINMQQLRQLAQSHLSQSQRDQINATLSAANPAQLAQPATHPSKNPPKQVAPTGGVQNNQLLDTAVPTRQTEGNAHFEGPEQPTGSVYGQQQDTMSSALSPQDLGIPQGNIRIYSYLCAHTTYCLPDDSPGCQTVRAKPHLAGGPHC